MKIEKKVLDTNDKVYSTCIGSHKGNKVFIGCSEGPGVANAFIEDNMSRIWDGPGGTMNFVPVPGMEDVYFATQKFLPVFEASECTLNLVTYYDHSWSIKEIMKFPYLHRFQLFAVGKDAYLFGATLSEHKDSQQDWSKPGSVFVGKLSLNDLSAPIELREIYKGITRNHGLWFEPGLGENGTFLVGGDEGAFSFGIPCDPIRDSWKISKLLDTPVSDMALCDIDNDGQLEMLTIEPFHGNIARLYKLDQGKPTCIKEYEIDFGHVVWGGKLGKKQRFLLGFRRGSMQLLAISYDQGAYHSELVDEQTGPSQVSVVSEGDVSYVLSANRQINELAVYTFTN